MHLRGELRLLPRQALHLGQAEPHLRLAAGALLRHGGGAQPSGDAAEAKGPYLVGARNPVPP